ncbi:MAG: hypothetical protein IID49_04825 [Proteobacteria bacterium]|nr:hypothetical protein [Pseudomonadota bacterium]
MMRHPIAAAALILAAAPALAGGEFSAGSEAKSWNLFGEEKARFEGKVVDALCLLTGDCPADCGAGKRQMGILRSSDGRFLLVNKNGQPVFTGASVDLAPYCGQTVEIDGLLVGDPDITPGLGDAKLFQVQTVRILGEGAAKKTNLWTKDWKRRNPDAGGKGPWFRRDPGVREQIEAHGRLGLGAEADRKYIEETF